MAPVRPSGLVACSMYGGCSPQMSKTVVSTCRIKDLFCSFPQGNHVLLAVLLFFFLNKGNIKAPQGGFIKPLRGETDRIVHLLWFAEKDRVCSPQKKRELWPCLKMLGEPKFFFLCWAFFLPHNSVISITKGEAGKELYLILSLPIWHHRALPGRSWLYRLPQLKAGLAGS